jgi:hypothetical protein
MDDSDCEYDMARSKSTVNHVKSSFVIFGRKIADNSFLTFVITVSYIIAKQQKVRF